jgi:hypothetical protein
VDRLRASADAGSPREAVEREVAELERLCADLETSLVGGDWTAAANALRDSRRVTHAFLNAMEAAAGVRDDAFDQAIHARMRRIFDLREDQLARLRTFHDGVGERLQTLSKWKLFARSIGAKRAPRRLGVDSRR